MSAPTPILSLPPYTTPSTARLHALYSDISRQKHSNPTSYSSNIEWWRQTLELLVSSGQQQQNPSPDTRLVLHAGARLMDRVRVDGVGKPLALGAVVVRRHSLSPSLAGADPPTPRKTELLTNKSLIPKHDFLSSTYSIYDAGWLPARIAAFVVGRPLWWALEQMGVVGEEGVFRSGSGSRGGKDTAWWGEYVFVSLVERAGEAVLERQAGKVGGVGAGERLYSREGFRREFGGEDGTVMSEGDAAVLLRFLERDKKAVLYDKEVVKFLTDDPFSPREINAADRGILELRSAVQNLHAQVDGLQGKMDECTQKATLALQQKRKPIALSHLRLRKQLEDLLSKRLGSLDNLEATLLRVEAAAGDIEMMKSYESSTTTLRAILAHPSLQKDSIDATLDALAEVNADAREVDEAVRVGGDVALGVSGDEISESELEDELAVLVREAEEEREEERRAAEVRERLEGVARVPEGVSGPTGPIEVEEKMRRLAA
ncbi:hypothetical protein DXG03_000826 [Asterophora parasitica]|uniref:Snf7 n=1 Tax=Asterophora parasitica TaxID=117018 RepID=A0A9P7GB65_9AGAR|nr:hypothetical protein DXG03_000826 [Asterophora parasitica]